MEARIEGLRLSRAGGGPAMRIMEGIKLAMNWPGLSGLILLGLIAVLRLAGALLLRILESLR